MLKRPIGVDNHQYNVDYPDSCPICHHHGEISVVNTSTVENGTGVQVVYQCAWKGCKSYFIGYYPPKPGSELKALKPIKPQISQFPEAVAKLSPTFISVFREAEEAAALGLSQIAGPGYRKAFEFLIKEVLPELLWVNDLVRSLLTEDADERHRTLRADSWSQSPLVC